MERKREGERGRGKEGEGRERVTHTDDLLFFPLPHLLNKLLPTDFMSSLLLLSPKLLFHDHLKSSTEATERKEAILLCAHKDKP